jgi:hypothetical protein
MLKYATAEMYQKFQDSDFEINDQWEINCSKYEARLKELESRFPVSVNKFLDEVCLHDAEMYVYHRGRFAILQQNWGDNRFVCLLKYELAPSLIKCEIHSGPGFSSGSQAIWLYDEFDLQNGEFQHSILLSTGLEMEINFTSFSWLSVPLPEGLEWIGMEGMLK